MKNYGFPRALTFGLAVACVSIVPPSVLSPLHAQTTISGDLSGSVTDPTGAAIPGAKITAINKADGATSNGTADQSGVYRLSLLKPGLYTVNVTAPGFGTNTSTVTITVGSVASLNSKLIIGQQSTVVEVTDQQPLLQTTDAQISTTFDLEQIQALPNPGGDITYYAQTAPGVVMNTGGGYGNFSVFGLPGTSNNFTVNGEQENDPFLNLNNSGPTNLLLGQNDISSVTVLTNAYGAEFGSFGGAQINEISRSGTNKFHGDASYYYNGRALNSNNWFTKRDQAQAGQPSTNFFDNNNQWSAAIGGPIIKDKTFFFFDTEGIRFITAKPSVNVTPSALYQSCVLAAVTTPACAAAGVDSLAAEGNQGEAALYQKMFALYNGAPGLMTNGKLNGGVTVTPDGLGYEFTNNPRIFAKESLVTARIDQVIGAKDTAFIHFKYDNGTQPSYVDPISTVFNAISNQPEYEGQIVETHTFSPRLVNQFLFTAAHYTAVFQSANQPAATAALPFDLDFGDGEFNLLGGINYAFPQGRNATQYQIADDVSYTIRNHELKFGYAFKKDDITDFDVQQETTTPLVVAFATQASVGGAFPTFDGGLNYLYQQSFPTNLSLPVGVYSEGFYGQDTWKATKSLTLTAGIRFEHNSNPTCPHNCYSRLNQQFSSLIATGNKSNTLDTPYNSVISANQGTVFPNFEKVSYEPRFEVAYQVTPKTVIRGGFGMFSDVFPGQVADDLLKNIPQDPQFTVYLNPLLASQAGSGQQLAAQSNTAFRAGYPAGGTFNTLSASVPGFSAPNLFTAQNNIHYPTYEEFSLQFQQELTRNTSFEIAYAGNHGYHEPVVAANANASTQGEITFAGIPTNSPAPAFGAVTDLSSTASSKYSGLLVSIIHRSKYLTAQLNYTYSHALDQISNGGFLGFTGSAITGPLAPDNLQYNYGNADYDVRNSLNGNYLIQVPSYGTGLVKSLTGGFQIAGTVFYRAGFPFTVTDGDVSNVLTNYSGAIPALRTGNAPRFCSGIQAATGRCLGGVNAAGAVIDFTDPTGFIPGQRNAFFGPHYFNTDLTVNKAFTLPFENLKMQIGANFYNVLNHPNFANPVSDIANTNEFGQSLSTVSVPTSIYGSGLGGDASTRIVQLHAKVSF